MFPEAPFQFDFKRVKFLAIPHDENTLKIWAGSHFDSTLTVPGWPLMDDRELLTALRARMEHR